MSELTETADQLAARHRKEKKELTGCMTALKRSGNNANKVKKKEIAEEIARRELELSERQKIELQHFQQNDLETKVVAESDMPEEQENKDFSSEGAKERISKAEKRRMIKEEKNKQRDLLVAEAEVLSLGGVRHLEAESIQRILHVRNLQLKEINADGDCLYSAVLHQLTVQQQATPASISELRRLTAEHLRSHVEEFLPFITSEGTNEVMNELEYQHYCDKVRSTKAWGGQPEVKALSSALAWPIEIVQASGSSLIVGEEFAYMHSQPLIITYHRHLFNLGEHYNSVEARRWVVLEIVGSLFYDC